MISYKIGLLRQVRSHLKRGGVIAYPTEFCFGFGCDPFNHKAINKIIRLKQRDKKKGLIVIAAKTSQLNSLTKPLTNEVNQYWPGAFSLVVQAREKVPFNLSGKSRRIAVRVTAHKPVIQLCKYINIPLVSTSANKSGFKPVRTYLEGKRLFGAKVLVLPGTTGFAKRPSVIIDWENHNILR